MKKTLLATSLLAAFGAASAQVTIGGLLDLGYASESHNNYANTIYSTTGALVQAPASATGGVNPAAPFVAGQGVYNGATVNGTRSRMVTNAQSRLFFAGSEALGNSGLKANFRLEMGIDLGSGAATGNNFAASGVIAPAALFQRAAWAGLSSGAGYIQLGKQGTASASLICGIVDHDACLTGFNGGGVLFTGAGQGTANNGGYIFAANAKYHGTGFGSAGNAGSTNDGGFAPAEATRYTRALVAETTSIAGFKFRADYATDGNSDVAAKAANPLANGGVAPKKEESGAIGVSYANGAWSAGVVSQYGKMGSLNRNLKNTSVTVSPAAANVANAGANPYNGAGQYNPSGVGSTATIASPNGTFNEKGTINTLGLRYKSGPLSVGGGYQAGKSSDNLGTAGSHNSLSVNGQYAIGAIAPYAQYNVMKAKNSAGNAAYNSKVINVGVNYILSPRTKVYIDIASDKGLINAGTVQAGAMASTVDQTVKGKYASLGMRHAF
jgi:predicted porin